MGHELTADQARAALAQGDRGRNAVIGQIDMPAWYWWGLALGWIAVGVAADADIVWLSIVATLAFGAAHAVVSTWVLGGRRRSRQLSVRRDVAGRHTPQLIIASLIGLVAVTILLALAAHADGANHPSVVAAVFVAIVILLGGPRLMAAVRTRAARSDVGDRADDSRCLAPAR